MGKYMCCEKQLISEFAGEVYGKILAEKPVVFLCVGATTVVADCLGPIVGELLIKKYNVNATVYGNIKNTVTASNLSVYLSEIYKEHSHCNLVVIDACAGTLADAGLIKVKQGGCIPAGFTGKSKLPVGDFCILGNVNVIGLNHLLFLKSVKLNGVLEMAEFIAKGISQALKIKRAVKA